MSTQGKLHGKEQLRRSRNR